MKTKIPIAFLALFFFFAGFSNLQAQTGYSAEFDGVDDYVEINSLTNLSGTDLTIEFWFKGTDIKTAFAQRATDNFLMVFQNVGTGDIQFGIRNAGTLSTFNICSDPADVNDNAWHHVAASYDNITKEVKTYFDGELITTGTSTVVIPNIGTESQIGRMKDLNGYFTNGLLDEYRIWTEVRSQTQLTDNMYTEIAPATANLLAYYRFNGDFTDETTNNYDGTATGGLTADNTIIPFTNWLGTADTDWGTGTNWEHGEVPDGTNPTYVVIEDQTYDPVLDANRSVVNLMNTSPAASTGSSTLTVTGFIDNAGGVITGTGTVELNGLGAAYELAGTFPSLQLNDVAGAVLTAETTVTGNLIVGTGTYELGDYDLVVNGDFTGVFDATNMVIADKDNGTGMLVKTELPNATGITYPVGDADGNYTPATITNQSGSALPAGQGYGVNLDNTNHPFYTNTTNVVNRHFTVAAYGGLATFNYDFAGNYLAPGDVVGTPVKTGFYNGTWTAENDLSGNQFLATGMTDVGDFSGGVEVAFALYSALVLDGTDDYVEINSLTNLSGTDLTIEFWFKGPDIKTAFAQRAPDNFLMVFQNVGTGDIQFGIRNAGTSSTFNICSDPADVNDNAWHHVAASYDNTTKEVKTYFDGELITTGTSSVDIPNIGTESQIGRMKDLNDYFTNGLLDEYRIWSEARTQADIQNNMYTQIDPTTANLLAYYRFNKTADDLTATTFDGALQGDATYTTTEVPFVAWDGSADADWTNADNWDWDAKEHPSTTGAVDVAYTYIANAGTAPVISTGLSDQTANALVLAQNAGLTVEAERLLTVDNNTVIGTGATLTVQPDPGTTAIGLPGMLTINGDLTIRDGGRIVLASSTNSAAPGSLITNGAVTVEGAGGVEVQRFIRKNYFHYISSPIQGATSDLFVTASNPNFYEYLENTNLSGDGGNPEDPFNQDLLVDGWAQTGAGAAMNTGQGYAYLTNTYLTVAFVGEPNSGDGINAPVTYTGNDPIAGEHYDGWNLVGNPYPSPIDLDLITTANIDASYYITHLNGTAVYNGGVFTGVPASKVNADGVIGAMQGFYVHADGVDVPSLTFDNAARVHHSQMYLKDVIANLLRMQLLQSGDMKDEIVVRFVDDATTDFDGQYDGYKVFSTNPDVPQLYSLTAGPVAVALNTLPTTATENTIVPLGFRANNAGTYTFDITELNFEGNAPIYLVDNYSGESGVWVNLRDQTTYQFTHDGGEVTDRFFLSFAPITTGQDDVADNANSIYAYQNDIFVTLEQTGNSIVQVYDMTGRLVHTETLTNGGLNKIQIDLTTGTYIVRLISGNDSVSEKVFIK